MGLLDWLKRLLLGDSTPEHLRGRVDIATARERIRETIREGSRGRDDADDDDRTIPSAPGEVESSAFDLAGSAYEPIGRDELHTELRGAPRDPWANRSDLIPPSGNPRTDLIDRAMVTHGFISPEELERIHEVGAAMDEVRPSNLLAHFEAEQAVVRDREARAEIKARKKAEAAERQRRRQEEIAQRRATDIVFLGRGVSKGLADRRANVERLEAAGLPVLASPADVAARLDLTIPRLRWLAYHSDAPETTHWIRFTVPKKSGGERELHAPKKTLAAAQRRILRELLDRVPRHDAAHGFVRGRSTLTGARLHVGKDVVVNADLEDFFPTIDFWRVDGLFRSLGYSPAAATELALLTTESPRRPVQVDGKTYHAATGPRCLPQGAPTSPAISNLIARRLDSRLAGIAGKLGWSYSRYADDVTFSACGEAATTTGYLLARLRHIVQDEGFAVNEAKTRVLRRNTSQRVTGIVVNDEPNVPRRTVRRLRAILHRARTEGLEKQNRDGHPDFAAWVGGMVGYVAMVNPRQGERLRAALEAVRE